MIPKDKTMTSYIIQYLPKTKLVSLLITSELPLVYMCTYIQNPVIKDFGVF